MTRSNCLVGPHGDQRLLRNSGSRRSEMSDGGGNLGGPVLIRSLVYLVSKWGEIRLAASKFTVDD